MILVVSPHNLPGNEIQMNYLIRTAELDSLLRHSEHDTALFILGNSVSPGLLHLEHPLGPVIPHTGHDDADGVSPCIAGSRTEKNIYGRAVAGYQRPVFDLYKVSRTAALQEEVVVARRDECVAGQNRVVVGSLLYRDLAN